MTPYTYNGDLFFLSETNLDGVTLNPKIPKNYLTINNFEDNKTSRICFAPSIEQCLAGLSCNVLGKKYYVHTIVNNPKLYKPSLKEVPDSKITGEIWALEPVKLKKICRIKVTGSKRQNGKNYKYGNKIAKLYDDWTYEEIDMYKYKNQIIEASSKKEAIQKIIRANAEEVTAKWDNQPLMEQAMQEACRIAKVDDVGKLSDGYHTFDDLYWQRCILFAKLVELFKDKAWKTKRHDDGELCFGGDNFLVCIDTPNGPYSYHYPMKDWDLFKCKELYKAKPFDGHTSKDVERILSL